MKIQRLPKYWRSFFGGKNTSRYTSLKVVFNLDYKNRGTGKRVINRRAVVAIVTSASLLVVGGYFSFSGADPLPIVDVSGTLTSDTTWDSGYVYVVESQVIIPDGVTLTINPGAIIKYETGYGYNSIAVDSGGTLNADGTSENPVTFTSYKDDSVGGDSNGDGSGSSPGVSDYSESIELNGGDVSATDTNFKYAGAAISWADYGGSLSVSDSSFTDDALGVSTHDQSVSLEGNTFDTTSTPIETVQNSDLTGVVLAGSDENTFTGSTAAATAVETDNSTVPSGDTWEVSAASGAELYVIYDTSNPGLTVNGTLDVDSGVVFVNGGTSYVNGTLNLADGSIVKSFEIGDIAVDSGGTLNADGTSENPVTFTSYKDDSVGGDSNGDGSGSSPGVSDYSESIELNGGDVSATDTNFKYAGAAISWADYGGSLSVSDSSFTDDALGVSTHDQSVSLEGNTFDTTSTPIETVQNSDLTGVVLAGSDENTFTGSTAAATAVETDNSTVPSGDTWEVSAASGAELYVIYDTSNPGLTVNGTLDVDSGVVFVNGGTSYVNGTLNLADGSIVKSFEIGDIAVDSGGTLNADGTSENPVTFTSYKDDSVGGDSNGDGSGSSPGVSDYSESIELNGGDVSATDTNFKYAGAAISWADYGGSLSVSDSSFTDDALGVSTHDQSVSLEGNTFDTTSTPIETVQNSDLTGVVLAGSDENTFTGSTAAATAVETDNSTVPSGDTWEVSAASGAELYVIYDTSNPGLTVNGTLDVDSGVVFVNGGTSYVNGTLNLADGSIVKSFEIGDIAVDSGGTLNADGTSENPVTFTSYKDDSVGGDSNGDGSGSSPGVSDYSESIVVNEGGAATIDYSNFKYAGVSVYAYGGNVNIDNASISESENGLNVSGDAVVTYRGSFSDVSSRDITACKWGQTCSVDAAYTDWGSSTGPFASDPSSNMVCGAVTVSPWVYDGSTYNNSNIFNVENCDGSTTPDTQLTAAASSFNSNIGNDNIQCGDGFEDFCEAANTAVACLNGALSVAESQYSLPGDNASSDAVTFASDTLTAGSTYVHANEVESVTGDGLGFAGDLIGAVNTIVTVAQAYNNCDPG